jgi:hypothetical protein
VRAVRFAVLAALAVTACSKRPAPTGVDASHASGPETECAGCHPSHFTEWRTSSHAYAMRDPVFAAMVKVGQRDTQGELGDFCVKCHSPIGNATGETAVFRDPKTSEFVQPTSGLDPGAMDGVSCMVCHSITEVTDTFNAGFVMVNDGTRHGPIQHPKNDAPHRSEYSDLFEDAKLCGTCHMVVNPKHVALEQTYVEWVQSVFNGAKSCQDCHMPSRTGPAAVGQPDRTIHDHTFVGADVPLLPPDEFPGYDESRQRAEELLKSAVDFSLAQGSAGRTVTVSIKNLAGHSLPSGATADRQMWIELVVHDAAGNVVFQSGTLDEQGDLRVADPDRTTQPGTDPELVLYDQDMLLLPSVDAASASASGQRVDFLWEPNAKADHMMEVEITDRRSYDLGALSPGSYEASARLRFRTFPPHLLRKLEAEGGLDPAVKDRVPIVDMASASIALTFE